MEQIGYTHRYLARFIVEAATPLAIGSGDKDLLTDAGIALDCNGLPYIPGTSLAGVVRSMLEPEKAVRLFGYQTVNPKEGHGSEIIFSEARMIGKDGEVLDGLRSVDFTEPTFYRYFADLPIRQHVRINHRGTTDASGKFDEQVVFKGTRFCFEVEILYDGNDIQRVYFDEVLQTLDNQTFRIGGGSRRGFGQVNVISRQTVNLNLNITKQLADYLNKTAGLQGSDVWWENKSIVKYPTKLDNENKYDAYKLELHPKDFFLFGAGFGDSQADMVPVTSTCIKWSKDSGKLEEVKQKNILIPASSVKGTLAHRVAYYYNLSEGNFADLMQEENLKKLKTCPNDAVIALFGYEKKESDTNTIQVPGNVLFSDLIEEVAPPEKLLNHVSIDRFTGGTIDGALFTEKVFYTDQKSDYIIEFLVKKDIETEYMEAFLRALSDVCHEILPLGGGVNRGHGFFTGDLFINGKKYLWKD